MKFTNGNIEIELEHENTFNIAIRQGFKPITEIPKEEPKEIAEEIIEEPKKKLPADGFYNCKKCDFKTENQGDLLVHYRTEHPKKPKK